MFSIYLDNSHNGFRSITCSNCGNNTGTIVIEDLKFYGRCICDLCGEKFTYSSLEQCIAVQKVLEQAILNEYHGKGTPLEIHLKTGIFTYHSHSQIDLLPVPPLIKFVLKAGIGLFLSEVKKSENNRILKEKREEARKASYDIRPFFNNLDNHIINREYYSRYILPFLPKRDNSF